MVNLHPIAALLLGHVARHVCRAKQGLQRHRGLMNVHQTNADGAQKRAALPGKMQALHGLTQTLGDSLRHIRRAVFQQNAELIPSQSRQGVAFAQTGLQQRTDMAQQLIACRMAAGVVNQLELIQVEKH